MLKPMDRYRTSVKRAIKMRIKDILRLLVTLGFKIRNAMRGAAPVSTQQVKRILLVNPAHIGDVVISTSLLPILRAAYPSAEFGFLCSAGSRIVLSGHPEIRHTHVINLGKFDRGTARIFKKWVQERQSRAAALREVRSVNYDLAICLYTFVPDLLEFTWAAGIPERLGYRSSLHAAYATKRVDMPSGAFVTEGNRQASLLKALAIAPEYFDLRGSTLPPSDSAAVEELKQVLGQSISDPKGYRIVHMGAGAEFKELRLQFWRELAQSLSEEHLLLFTGHGTRESRNVEQVITGLPNCINACGRLSWNGFVAAVRHAQLLYGVDSAAGHVAAAVGTRCIVVTTACGDFGRWRPDSPSSTIFSKVVPCSPCYRGNGCQTMTCLHYAAKPSDLISLG